MSKQGIEKQLKEKKHITPIVFLIIFLILTIISFVALPILMSLMVFILILFPILLYTVIGIFTKRWVLSFFLSSLIYIIIIVILGFWIYTDTNQLINNAQTQPKYLLYREGNTIPFGIQITGDLDFNSPQESFKALNNEQIRKVLDTINNKDKFVIIIKKEFFNPLPETISIEMENTNIIMPKSEALAVISSPNPENIVLKYAADSIEGLSQLPPEMQEQIKQGNIPDELKQLMASQNIDSATIKLGTLVVLTQKVIQSQGIEYVFKELNNNNIELNPSYIAIWVIKHIPLEFAKPYLPSDFQNEINNLKLN